jgi:nicotinate-nucleotide pyrophosphorylase (carboxylating)
MHPTQTLLPLQPILYEEIVRRALSEDLGSGGDLTTDAIVSGDAAATALILTRAPGRIAGLDVAGCAFHSLDSRLKFEAQIKDGMDAESGETLAVVRGSARSILSAERTALNFLARLSGIATATRDIVKTVSAYPVRVSCTRKTTPGLRALEKYAVRAGGGANHRFGLDHAILIKDNHLLVAGGIEEAIKRARRHAGHMVKIEVEVDTLEQLDTALKENVDAVLLDNMPPDMLVEAVRMANKRVILEASGGVTPQTAAAVAATGVDIISVGWITHSAPALNISLELAFAS